MRVDIKIVISLPKITADQHLSFVDGVMDTFRRVFPEAEPLPRTGIDTEPPVTVTVHSEDDNENFLKYKDPPHGKD